MQLDIAKNRRVKRYTTKVLLLRVAWACVAPTLFLLSPRVCYSWRSFLLRCFGARVGRHVHVLATARITFPWNLEIGDYTAIGESARLYCLGTVKIGARATVSQYAHLCAGTHDYESPSMDLQKLPITIGDDVWVCADAFIGPNVTVGNGAVVGARTVVTKDVAPWTVVAGNPARKIKDRVLRAKSDG